MRLGTEPSSLAGILRAALAEAGTVLVFPSQVAADAWAVEALRDFGFAALDPARLIGWDRFKEGLLSRRSAEVPANRVTRTIWAAGIVARQGRKPFLGSILGPGLPSPAFVGFLAKVPPSLEGIAAAFRSRRGDPALSGDPKLADLLLLHDDCRAFMRARGLFEPSWEAAAAPPEGGRHLIVCPELIEDFEEYRSLLEASPGIGILELPEAPAAPPLLRFAGLHEELRHVFLRVGALLDGGMEPSGIGITVADLDKARPWVEAAARSAGVPLVFRRGLPLSSSPFGRLLGELGEAASSSFGLPAVEALLLDRFASWKEADSAFGLVRFGRDFQAWASYAKDGRPVDIWEESFRASGAPRNIASFYRRLRSATLAATGAPTFAALRSALVSFRAQFLDEASWSEGERRMVERAMAELDSLSRAEASYAGGEALPSPWALFMATLDEEAYVPQEGGGRVQVFPWRVSALLPFAAHFLVDCGQDLVRVVYGNEAFLREDQKEALGRSSREATEDFLRAYLHSGGSLVACHANEGLGGWTAPHPFFPGAGAEPASQAAEAIEGLDPLRMEVAAWRAESPLPTRLLARQKSACERAVALARKPERNFSRLDEGASAAVIARASRKDGRLRLSATGIDEYRACPFRWLVGRALGVGEPEGELEFFDARLAGEMAHRAIEEVLGGMALLGPLSPSRIDDYRALAAAAPAAILPAFAAAKGSFLIPMFEAWAPLLRDRLRRLVEAVAEAAAKDPGWEVGDLERVLEKALPDLDAVLEGRIDRLARRGAEAAIVDYKKKKLPNRRALLVDAEGGAGEEGGTEAEGGEEVEEGRVEAGSLGDSQVASYLTLAAEAGLDVAKVSFWSIELAKELMVVGEGGLRQRGGYGAELAAFDAELRSVARGIRAGDFPYAPPASVACAGCAAKAICRSHFATG